MKLDYIKVVISNEEIELHMNENIVDILPKFEGITASIDKIIRSSDTLEKENESKRHAIGSLFKIGIDNENEYSSKDIKKSIKEFVGYFSNKLKFRNNKNNPMLNYNLILDDLWGEQFIKFDNYKYLLYYDVVDCLYGIGINIQKIKNDDMENSIISLDKKEGKLFEFINDMKIMCKPLCNGVVYDLDTLDNVAIIISNEIVLLINIQYMFLGLNEEIVIEDKDLIDWLGGLDAIQIDPVDELKEIYDNAKEIMIGNKDPKLINQCDNIEISKHKWFSNYIKNYTLFK